MSNQTIQLYDSRLSSLIAQTNEDWGQPELSTKQTIHYNMCDEFDRAMWGLDIFDGELIGIQAPKKKRKSTLLANWAINFLPQLNNLGYWMAIDTLESGMTPKAYRDVLAAIMMTRLMVGRVFGMDRTKWPKYEEIINHPDLKDQIKIGRKFLRYGMRTPFQLEAEQTAKAILTKLPLSIFGNTAQSGRARDLEASMERWDKLYNGDYYKDNNTPHRVFGVDNIQQYKAYAGSSYYGLEVVTNTISEFVTSHPGSVVFAVSQVSLSSVRLAEQGSGQMEARGGTRMAEEAVVVFQTEYDSERSPYRLVVSVADSRYEPPPTVVQEIEPFSGTFLRPAAPLKVRQT